MLGAMSVQVQLHSEHITKRFMEEGAKAAFSAVVAAKLSNTRAVVGKPLLPPHFLAKCK